MIYYVLELIPKVRSSITPFLRWHGLALGNHSILLALATLVECQDYPPCAPCEGEATEGPRVTQDKLGGRVGLIDLTGDNASDVGQGQ